MFSRFCAATLLASGLAMFVPAPNSDCTCPQAEMCQCCARIFLNDSIIHINDTICADLTYQPTEQDLKLEIDLNGKSIFEDDIDLKDYEKECVGIPDIKKAAEICIDFDQVVLNSSYVGACASAELDVLKAKLLSVDLGCFHFNI